MAFIETCKTERIIDKRFKWLVVWSNIGSPLEQKLNNISFEVQIIKTECTSFCCYIIIFKLTVSSKLFLFRCHNTKHISRNSLWRSYWMTDDATVSGVVVASSEASRSADDRQGLRTSSYIETSY